MRTLILIGAVVLLGSQLQAAPGTWTGWITDAQCNPKGSEAEHKACLPKGMDLSTARLFIYDVKTDTRYPLTDQRRARPWVGQFVTVAGDMTAGVITIAAIAPAPAPTVMPGDAQGDSARDTGPTNTGPTVRGTDPAGRGASVSATAGTSTAGRTGGVALTDAAKPGASGASGSSALGLGGRPTNVLGARGEELRQWMPSLAEAIGAEIGVGLDAGTIAEIDGAVRGTYLSGRVIDFVPLVESAIVVSGGAVTGRTRSTEAPSVQATFRVAGRTSRVNVALTPRGEMTITARPD